MSSLLINQILMTIFATVGLLLPGILKQNSLPGTAKQAINGVIAFAVVILASIGTAYFANQLNIGNLPADFGVILTGISALLAGPLQPLDQFLVTKVNPGKVGAPPSPPDVTTIVDNLFTELLTSIKELLPTSTVTIHTTQAPIVQTPVANAPSVYIPPTVSETIQQPVANMAPPMQVSWQAQVAEVATPTNTVVNPLAGVTTSILTPGQQFIRHYGDTQTGLPVIPKQQ